MKPFMQVNNQTLCSVFPYKNVSIIKWCSSIWSSCMQRNHQPLLNFSKQKDYRILYVTALCILVLLLQGCDG
uniref:Transmembrane protein n=1 Tax=Medicago truncatula TaxID=3880 RepID=I3SWW9_MEDTR|nr:unknown [Medicago truncatula]